MTDTWTDDVAVDGVVLIGDAAGWSDPIIGQGMSVSFRDVHMITDVMTIGSDWSPGAFGRTGPNAPSGCAGCASPAPAAT